MNQWYRFTGKNWIGIMPEIVTGKNNDVVLLDKTGCGRYCDVSAEQNQIYSVWPTVLVLLPNSS